MSSGNVSGINSSSQSVVADAEKLSALLDGELDERGLDALLQAMADDPVLGQRWSRMCASHAAVEGVRIQRPAVDFAAGVMAAIDRDRVMPELVADAPTQAPATVLNFPVRESVSLGAPSRRRRVSGTNRVGTTRKFLRPAYGFAAAATVAAVAILAPRMQSDRVTLASVHQPGTVAVAQASASTAGRGEPVFFSVNPSGQLVPVALKETALSQVDPDSARTLDDYVIEHSNYRIGSGFGGSLGYARFAAHTADLRTVGGSH
jgi:negative regulator of sigma E activity